MATEFKKIMPRFVKLGDYLAQKSVQYIYEKPFQSWLCLRVMSTSQSVCLTTY